MFITKLQLLSYDFGPSWHEVEKEKIVYFIDGTVFMEQLL